MPNEKKRLMKIVATMVHDGDSDFPGKPIGKVRPNRKQPEEAWGSVWYSVLLDGLAYWIADDGQGGALLCAGGYRKTGPNTWGPPKFPVDNQGRRHD